MAILLLLSGVVLFGGMKRSMAKICPDICYDVDYVTCESSGDQQLTPQYCNCCFAPSDCTLYLSNGNQIHC
ncbi:hypothetical protein J5N97_014560 [Dioscorea zingiberensis]|uniref:Uncharacterized protein n=1 Tax=Dioscorea zingiberensis TaxID=325984 RepID=A0A9D5H2U7_9LILI|nr:hypothetical protein J5N97_000813 [Dioscorea zingiberensis]KAJ0979086.1 hypothetical protein J5N97_014560 [Dioscorea zingiberensis]